MADDNGTVKAPRGGVRIGGTNYPANSDMPERYGRVLDIAAGRKDPSRADSSIPPGGGRTVVPHVITFRGVYTSLARAYRTTDEALRDSVTNAHMMDKDPQLMGPIFARQEMVALLNWHIESEDDDDPKLKAIADEVTQMIRRMPRFTEYRRAYGEAIWYGRQGMQHEYKYHTNRQGNRRCLVGKWVPVSGDKLVFRFDDGTGEYDPDDIGIKVTPAIGRSDVISGRREYEYTAEGMAYFFTHQERDLFGLHRHYIRDAEYEDPLMAGSINGVGIRNFLYWVWYQKQETVAQLVELVDRTGTGITIYRYPQANDRARQEMERIAEEQAHTNVLVVPMDSDAPDEYSIEQIPPNTAGVEVLQNLIEDYFGDMIRRFVLGQTLSQKSDATGLGSKVAELHAESLSQVIRYDAVNLEETLTNELVKKLILFNFPGYQNADFWFRLATESAAPEGRLAAIEQAYQMGARVKTADVMDVLGLSIPGPEDDYLALQRQTADQYGISPGLQIGGEAADMGTGLQPQMESDHSAKLFGPVLQEQYALSRDDLAELTQLELTDRYGKSWRDMEVNAGGFEQIEIEDGKLEIAEPEATHRRAKRVCNINGEWGEFCDVDQQFYRCGQFMPCGEKKKQLAKGIKVEMEHTDDPAVARKIALDHLKEDPRYYDHLEEMERKYMAPNQPRVPKGTPEGGQWTETPGGARGPMPSDQPATEGAASQGGGLGGELDDMIARIRELAEQEEELEKKKAGEATVAPAQAGPDEGRQQTAPVDQPIPAPDEPPHRDPGTQEYADDVATIAELLGVDPAGLNPTVVIEAASQSGYNVTSPAEAARALSQGLAAGQHMMDLARNYGYQPDPFSGKIEQIEGATRHIVSEATRMGYQNTGDLAQDIQGALDTLSRGQDPQRLSVWAMMAWFAVGFVGTWSVLNRIMSPRHSTRRAVQDLGDIWGR